MENPPRDATRHPRSATHAPVDDSGQPLYLERPPEGARIPHAPTQPLRRAPVNPPNATQPTQPLRRAPVNPPAPNATQPTQPLRRAPVNSTAPNATQPTQPQRRSPVNPPNATQPMQPLRRAPVNPPAPNAAQSTQPLRRTPVNPPNATQPTQPLRRPPVTPPQTRPGGTGTPPPPVTPPEEIERKHPKRRKPNYRRIALLAVCAGVFVFSAVSLIRYGLDWLHTSQVSDEMRALYHDGESDDAPSATDAPSPVPTDPPSTDAPLAASAVETTAAPVLTSARTTPEPYASTGNPAGKFSALQKRNGEILGWLTIEGVVDEPVVKRDNTYYLTHNYLGQHSDTGALFMDQHVNLYPVPENIVIHGHNMKTGAMFGSLKKYKVKGASFLKEAGLVQLDTVMESATYAVFAVVVSDIRPEKSNFVNFIGQLTFSTDEQFSRYVEQIRTLSMVYVPMDVSPGDRLLTLSTCAGDDENERLLIFCRKIRADETALDFNYVFGHAVNR